MAVGRDGRPEAEAFLWEQSAKLRAGGARHGPFRPRAVAAVVVPNAERFGSHSGHEDMQKQGLDRQPDVGEKPAAGSGAAVVTERRRASPAAKASTFPATSSGNTRTPRSNGPPERQAPTMVPRAPAAPPRQAGRPPSRGVRLSIARACQAAPKIPAAPARCSERAASPRVRAMAAVAEASRAQTIPSPEVDADTVPAPAVAEESSREKIELAPVAVEELATITSPTKDKVALEKPVAGPPTLDDRPVATPTNSTRPSHFNLGNMSPQSPSIAQVPAQPSRGVEVAEMWLRLARIALLELTKLPPPEAIVGQPFARLAYNGQERVESHDVDEPNPQGSAKNEQSSGGPAEANPWMGMAFPEQELTESNGQGEDRGDVDNDEDDIIATESEFRAMQGWARIIVRVLSVTMAGPGPPPGPEGPCWSPGPEDTPLRLPPGACDGTPMKQGCAHICLGELMEESVSWVDVDSEDDQCSPKEADRLRAMQEAQEAEEVEMPRGMRDVMRQQNAPGLVAGMQKCLSF